MAVESGQGIAVCMSPLLKFVETVPPPPPHRKPLHFGLLSLRGCSRVPISHFPSNVQGRPWTVLRVRYSNHFKESSISRLGDNTRT